MSRKKKPRSPAKPANTRRIAKLKAAPDGKKKPKIAAPVRAGKSSGKARSAMKPPVASVARKKPSVKVPTKSPAKSVAIVAAAKPKAKLKQKTARVKQSSIILPDGYRPSDTEPFMNERHRLYFRQKLVSWKEEIARQNRETLHVLHDDNAQHADLADRATSETDRALELRARDRQRKLINKIDSALARIEDGSYGYCEETGEPIGLRRLDARPIATLSLEAQERHERRERVFRED